MVLKPLCPEALFSDRALGLDPPAQTWEGWPLHSKIKLLLTSEGVLPCLEKSILYQLGSLKPCQDFSLNDS